MRILIILLLATYMVANLILELRRAIYYSDGPKIEIYSCERFLSDEKALNEGVDLSEGLDVMGKYTIKETSTRNGWFSYTVKKDTLKEKYYYLK